MRLRFALAWIFVLGFSGCATLEKEAREKLELGEFDAALPLYERLVRQEAGNSEYQDGLKRSREGFIGVRLIEVRRARVSGNADLALTQLKSLMSLQNEWKLSPVGAARFSEDEETGYAWAPFEDRVRGAVKSFLPLLAEWEWRQFASLFTDTKYARGLDALGREVVARGKEQCLRLASSAKPTLPYYSGFVSRFCRHYRSYKKIKIQEIERVKDLFSTLQTDGGVQGFGGDEMGFLRLAWEEAFKASSWYDPAGKNTFTARWSGKFDFIHSMEQVTRTKDYEVEVNYQDVEYVTKTRVDGEGKTEEYQEPMQVTRTRTEQREYDYPTIYHRENIEMTLGSENHLGGRVFTTAAHREYKSAGDEHAISRPDIGLSPTRPEIYEKTDWVRKQLLTVQEALLLSLRKEWVAAYCSNLDPVGSKGGNVERVLRCAHDPLGLAESPVQSWYRNTLGVNPSEAEALIAGKL